MKVIVLSPYPADIAQIFESAGDEWIPKDNLEETDRADFVVSYGHMHIIREPYVSRFAGKIINLHISLLPWNRGNDPNFWSWYDNTPKGVTIHQIDRGLDTGPILIQRELKLSGTLATTYAVLRREMVNLFCETWPLIREGKLTPLAQTGKGSYHRTADKAEFFARLPLGFDTDVSEIKSGHKA